VDVLTNIGSCREVVLDFRRAGRTVGLVPTMGALHDGHISLIRSARRQCSAVVVTIFVNPAQFGPHEDFSAYPRRLEEDRNVCEAEQVDLVFAPSPETMYPGKRLTTVHVAGVSDVLCGPCRPGHFDGVATIVAKLFHIVPADMAFFGEKDFQQLVVIRRMVRDLDIPIEIAGCPTVREPDGLAMSSRNAYLSPSERTQATVLSRSLFDAAHRIEGGEVQAGTLVRRIREEIRRAGPCEIDYTDIVDAESLERLTTVDRPARICLAVRIGPCRLIDNVAVDAPPHNG